MGPQKSQISLFSFKYHAYCNCSFEASKRPFCHSPDLLQKEGLFHFELWRQYTFEASEIIMWAKKITSINSNLPKIPG